MHKYGQKYVNSVQTTFYYGPKKLIPLFSKFSRESQCSHAHIWLKTSIL